MADEDDFDIDIYGDEKPEFVAEPAKTTEPQVTDPVIEENDSTAAGQKTNTDPETEPAIDPDPTRDNSSKITATDRSTHGQPAHAPGTAGAAGLATGGTTSQTAPHEETYDTDGMHSREIDQGATTALRLGEMQWYTTEDDVRGWANSAGAEDELVEITFNEHKVNGKSKGEVYITLESPQAATAMRRYVQATVANEAANKKITAAFADPDFNPYKNAKDGQTKAVNPRPGGYTNSNTGYNNQAGGYRGGRGARGGGYQGGYNNNNNNSGYNNQQNGMMGGFGGNMGMGGGFGGQMGFNRGGGMMAANRGGFQANRGGRGGMMNNNMMAGMGPMNMAGMPGMAGMMMNMGNMGNMGGFGAFNPQQQQGGFNANNAQQQGNNPHGAKRPRAE